MTILMGRNRERRLAFTKDDVTFLNNNNIATPQPISVLFAVSEVPTPHSFSLTPWRSRSAKSTS